MHLIRIHLQINHGIIVGLEGLTYINTKVVPCLPAFKQDTNAKSNARLFILL